MLKSLAILCVLAVGVSSKPKDATSPKKGVPDNGPPASVSTYTYNAGCCSKQADNKSTEKPRRWYTPFEDPNWWLVLVAAATGGVVGWQAWETRKAANAGRDSIRFQEASLIQWIDIQHIGVSVVTQSKRDPPETIQVVIRWKVVNNTPLPFTVQKIQTQVSKDLNWMIYQVEEGHLVPPANGGARNFYPFFVGIDLDEEETKTFLGRGLPLSIVIGVFYEDASGNNEMREFGDMYDCKASGMEVVEALGKSPTMRVEVDGSPSTIKPTGYYEFDGSKKKTSKKKADRATPPNPN